jgi:ABC-type phosphate transport system permease subunit
LVSVVAGAMLLAFQPMSRLVAAGSLALSVLSLAMSWPVLEEAIERVQVARREAQGLPIREGEIESMQAMLPFLSVGLLAVSIVLLLLSRQRSS